MNGFVNSLEPFFMLDSLYNRHPLADCDAQDLLATYKLSSEAPLTGR